MMMNRPQGSNGTVLILIPDNKRQGHIPLKMDRQGTQIGVVRIVPMVQLEDGTSVMNLTHVLSPQEEIEYRRHTHSGPYLFRGELYRPEPNY